MRNAQPEALTLDRVATPVGEVLLVTDGEGAVRALDFADYEARMTRRLGRHAPGAMVVEGRAPEAVVAAGHILAAGSPGGSGGPRGARPDRHPRRRATVASISRRAIEMRVGNGGSRSAANHCASSISTASGRSVPPAYSAV